MAEYTNLASLFGDVADAIRDKTGSDELIKAEAFPEAIEGIPSVVGSELSVAKIINRTITEYIDDNGYIDYIGSSAFIDCAELTEGYFPECSGCGMWAFYGDKKLSKITIGKAEVLDNYAFRDCEGLMQIVLPNEESVATIYQYTFSSTPLNTSSFTGSHAEVLVPSDLVEEYKQARYWSSYASYIHALDD